LQRKFLCKERGSDTQSIIVAKDCMDWHRQLCAHSVRLTTQQQPLFLLMRGRLARQVAATAGEEEVRGTAKAAKALTARGGGQQKVPDDACPRARAITLV
jgi:hypothetical protein